MEKDIFKIVIGYLKYWYLFLAGILICSVLAFLHLRYNVIPEYYASCKILLNDKEEGASQGMESIGNLGLIKNSRNIDDEIGVLRSYDLMEQTIEELGFDVGYYVEGRFSEIEIYEKNMPFKIIINDSLPLDYYGILGYVSIQDEYTYVIGSNDGEVSSEKIYNFGDIVSTTFGDFHIDLNADPTNITFGEKYTVKFRSTSQLASIYNEKLGVYSVNEGALLELSLTDAIPQRAVDIVNKLIELYAQNSANDKNFLAQATLKLIDERLELLTEELNVVEGNIQDFKQNNEVIDVNSDAERYVGLADQIDGELLVLKSKIQSLDDLERSLIRSSDFAPISSFNIDNAMLISSIIAYNTEVKKRQNTINASGAGNPIIPQIEKQLIGSKNLIIQNIKGVRAQMFKSLKDLQGKLAQYRSKISSVPGAERTLLEINRDQGIKQNLYLFLLQKREEEALSISVPFSDTRIIETAKATNYAVNGGKMPIYLGAVLLGAFLPFAFLFIKDLLNTKVMSKEDIMSITKIPILGQIGKGKEGKALLVTRNNTTPVAELFRLMRYNLKFLLQNSSNSKVIMVTSGKPGEGKTFVSINLASSLAITDKKVVVLGFDLRVPRLIKNVGLSIDQGLSEYIVDPSINIEDILLQSKEDKNLFFISAGAIPPNPGELMLNERVSNLIKKLKEDFDYIVIDTPPVGKVADAYSLSNYVDSTLFVIRYNYTKKEDLKIINEIKENKKLPSLVLVLNDIKLEKFGAYSYGYGTEAKKIS